MGRTLTDKEKRLVSLRWDLRYYEGQRQILPEDQVTRNVEKLQRMINEVVSAS